MYDREGNVLRGPAERALRRYPARADAAGAIVVDIGGSS
jgi:Rieske Fe-S protein